MDHRIAHGVLLAAALTAASLDPSAAPQQVFRTNTDIVSAYATVVDAEGGIVTNLTRDDFLIFDNGRSQPLIQFESAIRPIRIIVMLDMSGSMTGNLDVLRRSAVQMFTRLLPGDQARVGNFGDRIVISPTFTNNVDTLIRALYLELEPGGNTPLWGAVNAAMGALARLDGRRVVLVLSDGKNTAPIPTLREVVERAQLEDFMVYAIGLRSRGGFNVGGRSAGGIGGARMGRSRGFSADEPDPGLRDLAEESGGGYFALNDTIDLGDTFARVADELHRQYLLGYAAPEDDGRVHTIEVKAADGSLKVRARRSYQAPQKR